MNNIYIYTLFKNQYIKKFIIIIIIIIISIVIYLRVILPERFQTNLEN